MDGLCAEYFISPEIILKCTQNREPLSKYSLIVGLYKLLVLQFSHLFKESNNGTVIFMSIISINKF